MLFFIFAKTIPKQTPMKTHPTKTWTRMALPFLFFIIGIVPAKAQLYLGGGFNYYTTEIDFPESDVTYLNISPELGYRYHKLSAGLAFSYNTSTYSNEAYTDTKEYTIDSYIRYDIIVRKGLGFFTDAFYSRTHFDESYPVQVANMVGVSPGIYYKLSDRFMAMFRFGFLGYSSTHYKSGFKGFGVDLSTNTAQIRFYYSLW